MTDKLYKENKDYKEKDAKVIRAELKASAPLLTFKFQKQGQGEHWIAISSSEYTSICPFSDFPDFGKVKICYVPDKKCLELKSFKLYINAFRNIKIFHETVTEVIFSDFLETIKPKKAKITVDMNVRGNIKTICRKYFKINHDE
ncbi:MAG: preQ(1) synthase [Candidatus Peregrinibacteria bacterium]